MIPLNFTIETPRLYLKAVDICDVDFVYSATRYNGFNDGLTWNPPTNKSELIKVVKRDLVSWEKAKSFMFTSELLENGEYVGRTGIRRINSKSEWSFGFWVHPAYQNNGYATEAGQAILDFGFSRLSASRIVTAHAIWNSLSKQVIEKLGFTYTRENSCGFRKNGNPVAEYEYELTP